MINGRIFPTKKPDLDNIAKIILDSLNKIAFDDDSHVISLSIMKRYSEVPKVKVIFHELDFL